MITVKTKQSIMKSLLSLALTFCFLLLVASCNSGAEKTEPTRSSNPGFGCNRKTGTGEFPLPVNLSV